VVARSDARGLELLVRWTVQEHAERLLLERYPRFVLDAFAMVSWFCVRRLAVAWHATPGGLADQVGLEPEIEGDIGAAARRMGGLGTLRCGHSRVLSAPTVAHAMRAPSGRCAVNRERGRIDDVVSRRPDTLVLTRAKRVIAATGTRACTAVRRSLDRWPLSLKRPIQVTG
jgi:hypothetical protein